MVLPSFPGSWASRIRLFFGVLTKYKKAFCGSYHREYCWKRVYRYLWRKAFWLYHLQRFQHPGLYRPWFGYAAIGWIMAFGVSFALSYVFVVKMDTGKKEPAADVAVPAKRAEGGFSAEIGAPAKGIVVPMKIKDDVFSGGVLGACIGVEPADGRIVAPADGKIVQVADTLHAIGIQAGPMEIIIHVGIDTVSMNGDGFESKVKQGQMGKEGGRTAFDRSEKIADAGHPATVITVVTNTHEFAEVRQAAVGNVEAGATLLKVGK